MQISLKFHPKCLCIGVVAGYIEEGRFWTFSISAAIATFEVRYISKKEQQRQMTEAWEVMKDV